MTNRHPWGHPFLPSFERKLIRLQIFGNRLRAPKAATGVVIDIDHDKIYQISTKILTKARIYNITHFAAKKCMLILAGPLYILFPIFIFPNLIHLVLRYIISPLLRFVWQNIDQLNAISTTNSRIDHLSNMVDYRPMIVDNIDPVAAVSAPSHKLCKIQHSLLCQPSSIEADCWTQSPTKCFLAQNSAKYVFLHLVPITQIKHIFLNLFIDASFLQGNGHHDM